MNSPFKILFRSFVQSFYKENAGFFVFLFTMMFYIVVQLNGAGLFAYHYSLASGTLKNNSFLLIVFFGWLLYARKYVAFVSNTIYKQEYSFLYIFNCLGKAKRLRLFVFIELLLLLPILLYGVFMILVGLQQHLYFPLLSVMLFLMSLCIVPAAWHVYLLNDPSKRSLLQWKNGIMLPRLLSPYPIILLRFVANKQRIMWAGVKLFTCGVLYKLAQNNVEAGGFDNRFTFIFFNFGILANGIIMYRIREFEETSLSFYRGVPVSLIKRFIQYALTCLVLLLPEFITAGMLVPVYLHYEDAIRFILCGYSLLLLMNSITFLKNFSMQEYLKILLLIFCVQYLFLLTIGLTVLYLLFFILAGILFSKGYYKFEQVIKK
ncbi:MAG: hypothetical protein ABI402_13970 [Ferruginibacter sp.]